jgi:hypothetical protein
MAMGDEVLVRAGVWKTRGGEQLEIRPSRVEGWPWLGVCGRTLWHYRDDGRVDDRGVMDEDLVEFVRPLPGDEVTTETLEQIERQAGTDLPEPDLEAWKVMAIKFKASCVKILRERVQLQTERNELQTTLANVTQSRDVLMMQVHDLQAEVERRSQPDNDVAVVAAHLKGVRDGKGLAFREVHNWLRPFVGANPEDAAGLLDAVPGLVKRLAECEGVTI